MNDDDFFAEIHNATPVCSVSEAKAYEAQRLRDEALKLVLQASKLLEQSIELDDKQVGWWDSIAFRLENIAVELGFERPYPEPLFPLQVQEFFKLSDEDIPF